MTLPHHAEAARLQARTEARAVDTAVPLPLGMPTVREDYAPAGAGVDTSDARLPISEVFGPTIQGEGPAAGRAASFLRFMGCNLSCAWCDTPYTWDGTRHDLRAERTDMTVREILRRLPRAGVVVLTGGEPLLQQGRAGWRPLLRGLAELADIHIETNGTIAPDPVTLGHADLIVVSPKMWHAGAHRGHQNPSMAREWAEAAEDHGSIVFKIVVRSAADVADAADWCDELHIARQRVWVMPEGVTTAVLEQRWPGVAQAAADRNINASHRLHVLAWGEERGH